MVVIRIGSVVRERVVARIIQGDTVGVRIGCVVCECVVVTRRKQGDAVVGVRIGSVVRELVIARRLQVDAIVGVRIGSVVRERVVARKIHGDAVNSII